MNTVDFPIGAPDSNGFCPSFAYDPDFPASFILLQIHNFERTPFNVRFQTRTGLNAFADTAVFVQNGAAGFTSTSADIVVNPGGMIECLMLFAMSVGTPLSIRPVLSVLQAVDSRMQIAMTGGDITIA